MTEEKQARKELFEWVRTLICTVLALLFVFTFVVRLVWVDGSSMRETLQHKDLLLAAEDWLCGDYERGDIVILAKPEFDGGAPIVKRVIAVENQTVDIDFCEGIVYVDGEPLDEPYTREPTYLDEGVSFPVTVPEGHVFVLGDNRNYSTDSRHPDLGCVDTRRIIGRAMLLLFPGKNADTEVRQWNRIGTLN